MSDKPKSVAEMMAEGLNPQTGKAAAAPVAPPVVAPVPAAAPAVLDAATLMAVLSQNTTLVNLIMAREQRELVNQQNQEARVKAIQKQRDRNAAHQDANTRLRQAMCSHLKGSGKNGLKTQGLLTKEDYAVARHIFVNSDQYIKCLICGMKWRQKDTAEYLFRKGKQVANHTKIGWMEAVKMLRTSTNTTTMSERVLYTKPITDGADLPQSGMTDEGESRVTPLVDREGNAVTDFEL